MIELSDRQTRILKAIIEEYIETAAPVGSETLEKKYNLEVSPATIRNEMAKLAKIGLLKQSHVSSGRSPTTTALKFYIHQLMEEQQLGLADEVALKEKIWDFRHQPEHLLFGLTHLLAQKTNSLAVAVTDKEEIYRSGYANILDMPEFFDIDVTKTIFSLIEDFSQLNSFFSKANSDEVIHILMGEDFGLESLNSCSLVFSEFNLKHKMKGYLGVIGPCRLNYSLIIPTLRYCIDLLKEIDQSF